MSIMYGAFTESWYIVSAVGITWEKDSLPAIVTQPSILIILKV